MSCNQMQAGHHVGPSRSAIKVGTQGKLPSQGSFPDRLQQLVLDLQQLVLVLQLFILGFQRDGGARTPVTWAMRSPMALVTIIAAGHTTMSPASWSSSLARSSRSSSVSDTCALFFTSRRRGASSGDAHATVLRSCPFSEGCTSGQHAVFVRKQWPPCARSAAGRSAVAVRAQ
jgi:hypothetical protein